MFFACASLRKGRTVHRVGTFQDSSALGEPERLRARAPAVQVGALLYGGLIPWVTPSSGPSNWSQADLHSAQAAVLRAQDVTGVRSPAAGPRARPAGHIQQFFRGLPEAEWSAGLNARLLQIAQTKVPMYDAYISEMEQM